MPAGQYGLGSECVEAGKVTESGREVAKITHSEQVWCGAFTYTQLHFTQL